MPGKYGIPIPNRKLNYHQTRSEIKIRRETIYRQTSAIPSDEKRNAVRQKYTRAFRDVKLRCTVDVIWEKYYWLKTCVPFSVSMNTFRSLY